MNKKRPLIVIVSLMGILIMGIGAWLLQVSASSLVRLTANPAGNAADCVHHPSRATCQEQVSPFGTGPGAPGCALHASIQALVDITDPTMIETPLATLQVWWAPVCHSVFASAYTSTFLGQQGTYSLSVSIAHQWRWWWYNVLRQTTLHSNAGDHNLHAWTPLLFLDDPTPKTFEACLSVVTTKTYRVCTTVLLQDLHGL